MVVSWILRGIVVGLGLSVIIGLFWGMAGLGLGVVYLVIMHLVTYLPAGWIASSKGDHPWIAAGVAGGFLYLFNFLIFPSLIWVCRIRVRCFWEFCMRYWEHWQEQG